MQPTFRSKVRRRGDGQEMGSGGGGQARGDKEARAWSKALPTGPLGFSQSWKSVSTPEPGEISKTEDRLQCGAQEGGAGLPGSTGRGSEEEDSGQGSLSG